MLNSYFPVTTSHSAQVFEGHPFIVEAGISVGGKDVKQVKFRFQQYLC
jgi:DNA topoisomerase VI subunit B